MEGKTSLKEMIENAGKPDISIIYDRFMIENAGKPDISIIYDRFMELYKNIPENKKEFFSKYEEIHVYNNEILFQLVVNSYYSSEELKKCEKIFREKIDGIKNIDFFQVSQTGYLWNTLYTYKIKLTLY